MASLITDTSNTVGRKSFKGSGSGVEILYQWIDRLAGNSRALITLVILFVGISAAGAFLMSRREARSDLAKNALFIAEKSMDRELKALMPVPPKTKASPPPLPPNSDLYLYKKLDVEAKFPESIKKLKAIDADFGSARAAFEARLALGDLYFDHGEPAKAIPWYEKAVNSAPATFEKVLALSAVGYAYENSGRPKDAIQFFEKAISYGEASVKGDLLLALARSYELLHDTGKARNIYEQIQSQLPNTEYAKAAQAFKALLE